MQICVKGLLMKNHRVENVLQRPWTEGRRPHVHCDCNHRQADLTPVWCDIRSKYAVKVPDPLPCTHSHPDKHRFSSNMAVVAPHSHGSTYSCRAVGSSTSSKG